MHGDLVECRRCGKKWSVIAHDGHMEQRGYKYAVEYDPSEKFTRRFMCPCRSNGRMPSTTISRRNKNLWKKRVALEGRLSIDTMTGSITIGDTDLTAPIWHTFEASRDDRVEGNLHGSYRITIEKIALEDPE